MSDHPSTASFAEFARMRRYRKSYVTQLRHDDRLVLTADGKAVRVAESIARIAATADPAMAAAAARQRAPREAAPAPTPDATLADDLDGVPGAGDDGYQYWRRRTERAKALAAERDNRKADGDLLDATDVARSVSVLLTTLRTSLETLPEVLAPQLGAISDEAAIRKLIAEEVEHQLDEAARGLVTLGKAGPA